MKKLICLIFGHKRILKNWYPNDKITTLTCLRCDKIIKQYPNPAYQENVL